MEEKLHAFDIGGGFPSKKGRKRFCVDFSSFFSSFPLLLLLLMTSLASKELTHYNIIFEKHESTETLESPTERFIGGAVVYLFKPACKVGHVGRCLVGVALGNRCLNF